MYGSTQNALDSLREEQFLWKSQRGAYSIEDEQFLEWLNEEERPDEVHPLSEAHRG